MFTAHLTSIRNTTNNWLTEMKQKVNGRSPKLLCLDSYIAGKTVTDQQFVGRQTVSVSQIQGSLNPSRCRDFDGNFRLLHNHGQERLSNVAKAAQRKTLSPISLVQVGDTYFVNDGHHRVAIATANEQKQIIAHVTVIQIAKTTAMSAQPAFA